MQVSVQETTPLYPVVASLSEHLQEQLAVQLVLLFVQVILRLSVLSLQVLYPKYTSQKKL